MVFKAGKKYAAKSRGAPLLGTLFLPKYIEIGFVKKLFENMGLISEILLKKNGLKKRVLLGDFAPIVIFYKKWPQKNWVWHNRGVHFARKISSKKVCVKKWGYFLFFLTKKWGYKKKGIAG